MDTKEKIIVSIQEVIDEFKKNPMDFFSEREFQHLFEQRFRERIKDNEFLFRERQVPGSTRKIDIVIEVNKLKYAIEFYYKKASNNRIEPLLVSNQKYFIPTATLNQQSTINHLGKDLDRMKTFQAQNNFIIEFYRIIIDMRITRKGINLEEYQKRMQDIIDLHRNLFKNHPTVTSVLTELFILWDGQSATMKTLGDFKDM